MNNQDSHEVSHHTFRTSFQSRSQNAGVRQDALMSVDVPLLPPSSSEALAPLSSSRSAGSSTSSLRPDPSVHRANCPVFNGFL